MARRKKSTGADVFFDLTSKLPWWVCLGIAVVGYYVLHKYATSPFPPPVPGKVPDMLSEVMFKGFATGGQYIVAILFFVAAIVSFIRNRLPKSSQESPLQDLGARPVRKSSTPAVACPECGSAMVQRSAKRGANAGKLFWGCTNYPKCKGIRAIQ